MHLRHWLHQDGEKHKLLIYLNHIFGEVRFESGKQMAVDVGLGHGARRDANEANCTLTKPGMRKISHDQTR
jgi:prefoldin subunit 5